MRIETLRYVQEIYKYRSMKSAAEALFISPQAIGAAIKSLEEELDLKIFYRSNKGVSFTNEGLLFLEFVNSTVENYQIFLEKLDNVKKEENSLEGNIIFYVAPIFFEVILPEYINQYKHQFPNVSLSLIQRNTLSIARLFMNKNNPQTIGGLILPYNGKEIITDFLPDYPEEYEYKILNKNSYKVCVPKNSFLAEQESITINKLLEYPLIDYCAGECGSSPLVALLKKDGKQPNISFSTSSFIQWKKSIQNDLGIGVMNSMFLEYNMINSAQNEGLKLLKIQEPLVTYNCLCYSKNATPAVLAFLNQFPEHDIKLDFLPNS